jgi:uncharacterized glyoxalase superfamily protein PhnB
MIDADSKNSGSTVVPVLRYRNLPAAVDWLCKAFGFARHRVTVANDGSIQFAQLTLGDGMVMVGAVGASAFDKLLRQPDEVGGAETQVCYSFVGDAHAHCARARAAGAEIVFDVTHATSGGRSYSCRDPEGHLWNFGTYSPWRRQVHHRQPRAVYAIVVAGLLLGTAVLVTSLGVRDSGAPRASRSGDIVTGSAGREKDSPTTLEGVAPEKAARASTGRAALDEQQQPTDAQHKRDELDIAMESQNALIQALRDKEAAERFAKELQKKLDRMRTAKDAERAALIGQQQLKELQLQRDQLQNAVADTEKQLMRALDDKKAAEQLTNQAQKRLARALNAKNAAKRATKKARRRLAIERAKRAAAESANQVKKIPFPPW